jgi:hypothetical protein
MHHHRGGRRPVAAGVVQSQRNRKVKVDLDGGQGLLAAAVIADLHVELGAVEGCLSWSLIVGRPPPVEDLAQLGLGALPHRVAGDVLVPLTAQRQAVAVLGDTEHRVGLLDQVDRRRDLVGQLLGRAEDVAVVERHLADP